MARRWAVVGGGMLGLVLARSLRGHEVTVYEAAPALGGLASAWQLGPVVWDRHYHVTLMSDRKVLDLLESLHLSCELRWAETRTGFFTDGQLYSMSNSLEFLKFPPLGLIDKARLAATIVVASRIRDWRRMEQIGVGEWLTRLSGRRTFERMWLPLLRSKLGEAWQDTSAAFIWATIQRMYAARRSGPKKEQFGYASGGYARVLARLGEALADEGVAVRLGARVQRVGRGVEVDGERYDRAVVTMAPPLAVRLIDGMTEAEQAQYRAVRYQGIVCASLLLPKPLLPYYVTNITDDWVPFTGVIDMTALIDPAEIGGRGLVYLPRYLAPDHELFDADDDAIRELFVGALARMFPHFNERDIETFRVSRVRNVFPIPTLGYSTRVPSMRTSVPGVYAVSSAQILNGTLNVNETLTLAVRALGAIDA